MNEESTSPIVVEVPAQDQVPAPDMAPDMTAHESPAMDPNVALTNLGLACRLAKLNAIEHETCAASFDVLAKLIGYKIPPQSQVK